MIKHAQVNRTQAGLRAGMLLLLATTTPGQFTPEVELYGASCRASNTDRLSTVCQRVNESQNKTGEGVRTSALIFVRFRLASAERVNGFALRTNSRTGAPIDVQTFLYDSVDGSLNSPPDLSKQIASGGMRARAQEGWSRTRTCPAISAKANHTYYMAFLNPGRSIEASIATRGTMGTHYFFQGGSLSSPISKRWSYRVRCGATCPRLVPKNLPRIGSGEDFILEIHSGSPRSIGVLVYGATPSNGTPFPQVLDLGCKFWLSAPVLGPGGHGIDPNGHSRIKIPLTDSRLLGKNLYVQVGILDPSRPKQVTTNAIRVKFGL